MNQLQNSLLLAGLPVILLLSGYWLAARLTALSLAERLAAAVLTGLGVLLWNIATVNFFQPLAGVWAWICLWPIAATLLSARARCAVWQDAHTVFRHRRGLTALALAAGFLVLMLWPLVAHPSIVFYDGTSNHDSFFWISAAEYLTRHNYMTLPETNSLRPMMNIVPAILGMDPAWGRMGAEGFLALCGSWVGAAPLNIYLAASAALFAPWLAAVFLVTRTFLVARLSTAGLIALVALQPVFVFFFSNANLPNLLGALATAAVVVATERSLRGGPGRWAWLALLALSFHGLMCSYPEMIPFAIIPGGLLWLRAWFRAGVRAAWRPASFTALGWIAALALNPASTVRAWIGFFNSFQAARADEVWANLFAPLSALQYPAGLASLAVQASKSLPGVVAVLLALGLAAGLVLAVRRATDRVGAVLILAGAAALLAYTLATGFMYGWQKTVQFGGPLWVAVFPVAIIDALAKSAPADRRGRWGVWLVFAGLGGFFAYATVVNCLESHKWSERKVITQDWFRLREQLRQQLPDAPVLVEAASFSMSFFHGMWATYFLRDHDLYYATRGHESGGYLREGVKSEASDPLPPIGGILVGRKWADTLEANSPQLFTGDTVVLLEERNQVVRSSGLYPENGTPESAAIQATVDLRPHSRSELVLVLALHRPAVPTQLRVRNQVEGQPDFASEFSGPPPWRIVVPLTPGKLNHIELDSSPKPRPQPFPFVVREIRIQEAHD